MLSASKAFQKGVRATRRFSTKKYFSEPLIDTRGQTPAGILKYFENSWGITESLFSSLVNHDVLYRAPDKLRHPLIFYLGHPAIFYINKLVSQGHLRQDQRVNEFFEDIFAIGVDEMSWDDYSRPPKDWPAAPLVMEYRNKVKEVVIKKILETPIPKQITFDDPYWVFLMCMDHERIHIETSSCLFRQLPVELLNKPKEFPDYAPIDNHVNIKNEFIELPATNYVELGKSLDFPTYGWDNEYGKRSVAVPGFRATKYKITNGEFLQFVEEGGYTNSAYWSEEGWRWRSFIGCTHPLWWKKENGQWKYRTVWDEIEMPWNWPVDVNYLEAQAFCKWKGPGYRLTTEAEWHRMRGDIGDTKGKPEEELFLKQETIPGNINLRYSSSSAVNKFAPTSAGFYDVFGNVWEWTEDHNDGFPGFRKHPHYLDFSDPCFDSYHNIIQGGSWASTGAQASVFGRFAFRRHFMQHAGFRIAQTVQPVNRELYGIADNPHVVSVNHWGNNNPYEQDQMIFNYLMYAYEDPKKTFQFQNLLNCAELNQNFPALCAQECAAAVKGWTKKIKALDLGCAVGRSTFEMARFSDDVVGIDFAKKFIEVCNSLKKEGKHSFAVALEGKLRHKGEAQVDPSIDRSRCTFITGDACKLPMDIGTYNLVLAANLIDRVPSPRAFLAELKRIVEKDGMVVITTPYSWLEQYSGPSEWIGGYEKDGVVVRGFDGLKQQMETNGFSLVSTKDLPFLIRNHVRHFELGISHVSVWKKH